MSKIAIVLTLIFAGSFKAFGFEPMSIKETQLISTFQKSFVLGADEIIKIYGVYFYNSLGEKQLNIYLRESHILTFESEQLVVIGRDLTGEGKIDTWFYEGANGFVGYKQEVLNSDSDYKTMKKVFRGIFDSDGRWAISLLMKAVFKNLTLTGGEEFLFWANFEDQQINILDVQLRLWALRTQYPNDVVLKSFQNTITDCWMKLYEELYKHRGEDRLKMLAADVGLFVSGGLVIKGIGFASKYAINSVGLQEAVKTITQIADKQFKKFKNQLSKSATYLSPKQVSEKLKATGGFEILIKLVEMPLLARPAVILSDLVLKNRLTRQIAGEAGHVWAGMKQIFKRKGYIASLAGIQLGEEILDRGYFAVSDVPIILDNPIKGADDIWRKVASDKDLRQNLQFMTIETTVVTGLDHALESRGMSLKKRFLLCGVFSAINSIYTALEIKGDVNPQRMGIDTLWEVTIGNGQVFFDDWQGKKFSTMAESTGIKPLKYVAGIITFVHQATGFQLYGKTAEYIETRFPSDSSVVQPMIIPVLAP
jgi:hypothetical protein